MMRLRVQKLDGTWLPLEAQTVPGTANGEGAEVTVAAWRARWAIHKTGMVGNIGGNDWRIYTLHPDDCAALCAVTAEPEQFTRPAITPPGK